MSPEEQAERKKLAATPGLTRNQREAILNDPVLTLDAARIVLDVLRRQAAAFNALPEERKDLARKMGTTQTVSLDAVTNRGVTQIFGGQVEVPGV
jgi:hypothetical protein